MPIDKKLARLPMRQFLGVIQILWVIQQGAGYPIDIHMVGVGLVKALKPVRTSK